MKDFANIEKFVQTEYAFQNQNLSRFLHKISLKILNFDTISVILVLFFSSTGIFVHNIARLYKNKIEKVGFADDSILDKL